MSQKMRGEEATIKIAVDGIVQGGTMIKVTDFTATPRTDISEDEYLGEQESDLDIQHNGWDGSFSVDYQDAVAIDLCETIIEREQEHTAHPSITITVIYTFREPGARGRIAVYRGCFMKQSEEGFGGRKEKVKGKFEFKCKRRSMLRA